MRNTRSNSPLGRRLPRGIQLERVREVIQSELTPVQRETLVAYYFQEMNLEEIAQARGVNKSTVSRNLRRAEARLRKYLKY